MHEKIGKIGFGDKMEGRECHGCGKITTVYAIDFPFLCQHSLNLCKDCLNKTRTLLSTENTRRELFELYDGNTKWDYQCPPERRGAEIALIRILTGVSWKKANWISLNVPLRVDLESALKIPSHYWCDPRER